MLPWFQSHSYTLMRMRDYALLARWMRVFHLSWPPILIPPSVHFPWRRVLNREGPVVTLHYYTRKGSLPLSGPLVQFRMDASWHNLSSPSMRVTQSSTRHIGARQSHVILCRFPHTIIRATSGTTILGPRSSCILGFAYAELIALYA
jgi:hypothetical protein